MVTDFKAMKKMMSLLSNELIKIELNSEIKENIQDNLLPKIIILKIRGETMAPMVTSTMRIMVLQV